MKKTLLTLALLTPCLSSWADGNIQAGQQKASRCQACHGAAGKAVVPLYPHLAGQNAAYLSHALQAYQKGERNGGQAEVMKAFVSGLNAEDIDDLAEYYASLKP